MKIASKVMMKKLSITAFDEEDGIESNNDKKILNNGFVNCGKNSCAKENTKIGMK